MILRLSLVSSSTAPTLPPKVVAQSIPQPAAPSIINAPSRAFSSSDFVSYKQSEISTRVENIKTEAFLLKEKLDASSYQTFLTLFSKIIRTIVGARCGFEA